MEYWKALYRKILRKPYWKAQEGHVIEPVFHDGTEQYYQLKDVFNTFTSRAMDALSLYEQWGMRCTLDFLKLHCEAVDKILSDQKKISLMSVAELHSRLKERLTWAIPTEEIIYKFAAVAYFDRHESPYKYDNKYGEEKIKRWKENKDIDAFFLYQRTRDLIPLADFSETDFHLLLKMVDKLDKTHSDLVTSLLSSPQQKARSSTRFSSASTSA